MLRLDGMLFIFLIISCLYAYQLNVEAGSSSQVSNAAVSAFDFSPYYRNHCKSHPNKCEIIELTIPSLSTNNLINALESDDFRKQEGNLLASRHFYYVILTIHSAFVHNNTLHNQYEELDKFLFGRPWWKVQQYPVIYQHQSNVLPMVMEHVPKFVEDVSRHLLAVHFPPKEECLKKKLFVRTEMSSWGIDLNGIGNYLMTYPEYIHGFFIPNQGKHVNEGYVEKSKAGCGDKFNIRTCLFFDTTNCSYPDNFLQYCEAVDCPVSGIYDAYNRTYLGESEPEDAPHPSVYDFYPPIPDWKQLYASAMINKHPYLVTSDTAKVYPRRLTVGLDGLYENQWIFGMAYKYNHHLGIRVQEFLQDFYLQYKKPERNQSFSMNDNCVGVHIRKGDRRLPGVDMIEWCRNHTEIDKDGNQHIVGNWINGEKLSHGQYADMGCGYSMPFGAVNLQHIVNGSLLLANETLYSTKHRLNILIMSDEVALLEKELAEYHQSGYGREKVKVIIFPTKLSNVHKSRLSWEATVEWWAGIEAMKQCSAYLMHQASAASSAIHRSMCYKHGEGYMKCPPVFFIE